MSRKSRSASERCAVCGSKLRRKAITHQEWRKAHLHLVQNVPAQVCTGCGEVWLKEATLREVERLLRKGQPVRRLETPVYDFTLTGAK